MLYFEGSDAVLDLLLRNGAEWDRRHESGANALHIASSQGRVQCVKILLVRFIQIQCDSL